MYEIEKTKNESYILNSEPGLNLRFDFVFDSNLRFNLISFSNFIIPGGSTQDR